MSAWIQTYTGKQFFPLEPRAEDIDIIDIAHALSNLCRYGGHTAWHYSVAQHSIYVSEHCKPEHALWGLLHDASEAYLVDIPRPIKHHPSMIAYRTYEAQLERTIFEHYGLFGAPPAEIKTWDNVLLRTEQRDLMTEAPAAWEDNRVGVSKTLNISPWEPMTAERLFLERFHRLYRNPDNKSGRV
jgi:hypothetical protein